MNGDARLRRAPGIPSAPAAVGTWLENELGAEQDVHAGSVKRVFAGHLSAGLGFDAATVSVHGKLDVQDEVLREREIDAARVAPGEGVPGAESRIRPLERIASLVELMFTPIPVER